MGYQPQVTAVTRYLAGRIDYAILSQFDVVVVIDSHPPGQLAVGQGRYWSQNELSAFQQFHDMGGGIAVLGSGSYNSFTDAILIGDDSDAEAPLTGLKVGFGLSNTPIPGVMVSAGVPVAVRKDIISQKDTGFTTDGKLLVSRNADFYTANHHVRYFGITGGAIGQPGQDTGVYDPDNQMTLFTVNSETTLDAANDSVSGQEDGGIWTILIGHNWPIHGTVESLFRVGHMAYEPPVSTRYPALGRIAIDVTTATYGNLQVTSRTTDSLRMMSEMLVWLNRGRLPERALVYFTLDLGDQYAGSPIHSPNAEGLTMFGGISRILEDLLMFAPSRLGEPED
jgi:hypothetical protein